MTRRPWAFPLLAAAVLAGIAGGGVAATGPFGSLIGTFVGRAEDVDVASQARELRDIDIVVAPHERNGLKISWTNVTLVDGRRDVPGVQRRADEMILAPAEGKSFFIAGAGYDPFKTRGKKNPLAGEPLRWATLEDGVLRVHAFVVTEDGRYELQTYVRKPTEQGMTIDYRRYLDGELLRWMTGNAVRAE